jgi:hypothetical protein
MARLLFQAALHTSGMSNRADLSTPRAPLQTEPEAVLPSSRQAPGCLSNLKQTSWAVYYFSNQTMLKPHVQLSLLLPATSCIPQACSAHSASEKEMIVSHFTEKIEAIRKEFPCAPSRHLPTPGQLCAVSQTQHFPHSRSGW